MANKKVQAKKQAVVDEIKEKVKDSTSIILFDYVGLDDNENKAIRNEMHENDASYKIYKNSLLNLAFKDLDIDFSEYLVGPSALAFANDELAAIKVLTKHSKDGNIKVKAGIINDKVVDLETLNKLSKVPSREALLAELAVLMTMPLRNLAISLNLVAKKLKEEGGK